jgi:DNA-binding IclR family transcriptional regulator
MRMLYGQLNETILLSVLEFPDVLYIGKMDSDYPVRASARVGARAPAWRAASGISMLAFQRDELVAELASVANLDAGEITVLHEKLAQVRHRGYAISINGTRQGVNSVAAPIWSGDAVPQAAISVSGPAERFGPERMSAIGVSVLNAATRISESLGVGSPPFHDISPGAIQAQG